MWDSLIEIVSDQKIKHNMERDKGWIIFLTEALNEIKDSEDIWTIEVAFLELAKKISKFTENKNRYDNT